VHKRPMPPLYDRAGPDGRDLLRTRVRDDDLTARLAGAGLAVVRVEVEQSGERAALVVWRNQPSSEAQAEAEALIGPAQHVT
jgi:hypothetical protein